ncbi:hypothetical protein E1B28_005645 [Marasmius oreades]|uniref:Uncharacterized protein n=1 Tax=Marasmius oreades TaxID=181124 RepID=A0A9P7S507_9AGAR|nr:uncharacterized protein E1B28_005645 [Marasmius oreades]KAG7094836.1 hypothetical protein E1B28_005645 [Marasmius oreades]
MLPKAAYGVVKGAGKPEGFEPNEYKVRLVPGETTDFDHEDAYNITVTCQPSVLFGMTFAQHPDRWTECMVTPAIKREILSTPGYPKPLNRPPVKRQHIAQSSHGGLGVFATVDLKVGDLIFSERAIMILSPKIYMPSNFPAHFTTFQMQQAALCQKEKQIELVFGRLYTEHKKAYMALWNSHKEDGSGPLLGIFRTNAFRVECYEDDEQDAYVGVWNEASRFNHRKVYSLTQTPTTDR